LELLKSRFTYKFSISKSSFNSFLKLQVALGTIERHLVGQYEGHEILAVNKISKPLFFKSEHYDPAIMESSQYGIFWAHAFQPHTSG
jgi:hypothetical protein